MTTGAAWCPVTNMMLPENKVANSVAWQSISHGVSPKGVFGLFRVMEFF